LSFAESSVAVVEPATEPMYKSKPMPIPCVLDEKNIRAAIRYGLIGHGWIADDTEPGKVKATLVKGDVKLVIAMPFNDQVVNIVYDSSENMGYAKAEDGTEQIAYNYNRWIKTVVKETRRSLKRNCLGRGR
jgi:hypothetical protein